MNPEIKKLCDSINSICYQLSPELKKQIGEYVTNNDGSGIFHWVDGPGEWVANNDGSGMFHWVPNKNR